MEPNKHAAATGFTGEAESLRAYLLGSWRLDSYVDVADDGSVAAEPLGGRAEGLLVYAPDGMMSVQMMRSDRRPFASGNWFAPTPDELDEASRFIGYAGPYTADETAQSVVHHITVSFFPNWIGRVQARRVDRAQGTLVLTPSEPIRSGGKLVTPRLTWRRHS